MAHPPGLTTDGYELQFGTNYMAHALMLKLLLPTMLKTAEGGRDVRFVSVSSLGHIMAYGGSGIAFDKVKTADSGIMGLTMTQYGQSKLGNILLAKALAKRYPQITSVSIHPGTVKTDIILHRSKSIFNTAFNSFVSLFGGYMMLTPEQGAYNNLWAATAPLKGDKGDGVVQGGYADPVGKHATPSKLAQDEALADRLWDWTEDELKAFV